MATLAVRDIDPDHYQALLEQAQEHGRSVAAEVREIVAEVARKRRAIAVVSELKAFREKHRMSMMPGIDSVALIRAVRDEE